MRIRQRRIRTILFTSIFTIGTFTVHPANTHAISADDGIKTPYIVQMKDSKSLNDISQKYQIQTDNEYEMEHYLKAKNCIVLDLTEREAETLEKKATVASIEENIEVKALTQETEVQSEKHWNHSVMNVLPYKG